MAAQLPDDARVICHQPARGHKAWDGGEAAQNGPLLFLASGSGHGGGQPLTRFPHNADAWLWLSLSLPGDGDVGQGWETKLCRGQPEPRFNFTSMVWMRRKKAFILENAREEGNSQGTGCLSYRRDREEAGRASNIPAVGWGPRPHVLELALK